MKRYVKHIFCLSVIVLVIMVGACKKDSERHLQNRSTSNDFRDSITGDYYVAQFHESSAVTYDSNGLPVSGGGNTFTGYFTITVQKDTSDTTSIIIQGEHYAIEHRDTNILRYGQGGELSFYLHKDSIERYFNIVVPDHYHYDLDYYSGHKIH